MDHSPALDIPIRDRSQAALDLAKDALRLIVSGCKETDPVASQRAERTLNRIKELMDG